jgi:DNA/RNA-binding domain of Phe-tRNA-synthetase-like protein
MAPSATLRIDPSIDPVPVRLALIWGFGMDAVTSPGDGAAPARAPDFLDEVIARARASGPGFISDARKAAVRTMLRFGSYKPAGRSKPSSEYLLGAALAGDFPRVNVPVDVNNAISVEWGYPASIFDAQRTGLELLLRRGMEGESYAFNQSGQLIALEDLLCICRKVEDEWQPCGNPVKDSMATKVTASTTGIVAVIFAPADEAAAELHAAAERYSNLLTSRCSARQAGFSIIEG